MRYRRNYVVGGCYFFTVVTAGRRPWLGKARHVDLLRAAFRNVRSRHPFAIEAMVVLPDHLHAIWTLPPADGDYSLRWRLIKSDVSRRIGSVKRLWQPRFWEHTIRDEIDFTRHMDYIHYNPVKHGLAAAPYEWPHSSFAHCVRQGHYLPDWGRAGPPNIPAGVGHE
ncbi:REP-associated tyrosine transposase [Salinisphaera sp.]|uniref:REP-associated tyrosine transposase n=1 Tax=Salinisphaera sp. TaxID=1914330 RepID=UPI002D787708|nr:transposase [Salinisphaera sp.]HET7315281.1 transposase [Salinisphaera sp.]